MFQEVSGEMRKMNDLLLFNKNRLLRYSLPVVRTSGTQRFRPDKRSFNETRYLRQPKLQGRFHPRQKTSQSAVLFASGV